ncbi:MAG: hypothetical protein RL217_2030 [Pseudomonadota bacterium]|jgi:glutaredoxin
MQVIIYGKPNCPNCDKTKMLCQIQSLDYKHLTLDQDYSVEELNALVGSEVRALPQIFIEDNGQVRYVGDYNALRSELQKVSCSA